MLLRASKAAALVAETSPLVQALINRGISAASARRLVSKSSDKTVEEKIALFDWLTSRKDVRVQKSPAGFLYRAITEDFPLPEDYQRVLHANEKARTSKVVQISRSAPKAKPSSPEVQSDRSALDRFWNSLSVDEQNRIEGELVKNASPFQREHYQEGRKERGPIFRIVRQSIIDEYVRKTLGQPST